MIKIEKGVSMKNFSTFRIGGEVAGFCWIKKERDFYDFIVMAEKEKKEIFFLGGGSNLLFRDGFWPGWIAKIENNQIELKEGKIVCGAGVSLAQLANFTLKNHLTGMEWAVGIPGTVGGAVRGNAGAFGGQMADCVEKVVVFDGEKRWQKRIFSLKECDFGYRESVFKKRKEMLIWEIVLALKQGSRLEIKERMDFFLNKRKNGQPKLSQFPSAGSIFKNPLASREIINLFERDRNVKVKDDKVPAGWLIDRCGLKGKRIGDAQVSFQQANFIVNLGGASASDVKKLIKIIKEAVRNKFSIELEEEIEIF